MAVVAPKDSAQLPAIWCFCSSPKYNKAVRRIDQSLKVTNATLVKVPFDLDHWTKVAAEQYPNGLPKPYTDDPTQWVFHGHPCGSVVWDEEKKWTDRGALRTDDTVLHVAVARLLGYRWPAEFDADMELADEQRELVNRCEALACNSDDDGIVCIPPVRGRGYGVRPPAELASRRLWRCLVQRHLARVVEKLRSRGQGARDLAAGEVFQSTQQAVPSAPLHLAHLGWPARRLRRPGQLP